MIFGILIIGILLLVSALKNTQNELGGQLVDDMTGSNGFLVWAAAIIGIGAIGYLPYMRGPSRALLVLLAIVMVLRNGGVFQQAQTALQNLSAAPSIPTPSIGSDLSGGSSGSSSSSSSGSTSQEAEQAAEVAAMIALA